MNPSPNRAQAEPRVALVTGGANRIGAAMAKALAAAGWQVVIHYRASVEQARATLAAIRAAGGDAALVKADLASRPQRSKLIANAAKPFGPLTALINNASLFESDSVADLDEALWDRHFAVHAEAPAFLARDFSAQLPEGVQGNIVNIIDERVLHLTPNHFSYTLSKAALWTMTTTLAQSLAPRIRVNAIGPGPTLREAGQSEAAFARNQASAPLGYGANPGDIVAALHYLLEAKSVTGQMIPVDGGRHIDFPASRSPTPRRAP